MEWIPPGDISPGASVELEEMKGQDDPVEYHLGVSFEVRNDGITLGCIQWSWVSDFERIHLTIPLP